MRIGGKLAAALCITALAIGGLPSAKAEYPERPITLVVPYPPGGTTDALARIVASELSRDLGKPVVVDNKGGAGGILGSTAVARSAADGYTLLFGNVGPNSVNPSVYKNLPYDAVRSFKPISLVAEFPLFLVVHPSVPANNVLELIKYAKTRPTGLDYASVGIGSMSHLTGELFASLTGAPLVHVPYKGGGPAISDVVGGQVPMMFLGIYDGNIKGGKLRAIATSSASRASVAPEVPTIAESGVAGFDVTSWFGILAPADTPAAVIGSLNRKIIDMVSRPDVRSRIEAFGGIPKSTTPDAFAKLIADETVRWKAVIKDTPKIEVEQ